MSATIKRHKTQRKHRSGFLRRFLRSLGFVKKYHRRKSKTGSTIQQELELQSSLETNEAESFEDSFQGSSPKSKAKYKKAISSRKNRKKRKLISAKWRKKWQNVLYFLNLRIQPYDPFSNDPATTRTGRHLLRVRQYVVYIFNSTVIFLITYIIAYLTYQFTVIIVASFFGIDSVLYYYELMFPIGNFSSLWTAFNIILITISGPLVSLIMGMVYYRFFMPKEGFSPLAKLFFLWLSFHSFNMFFGAYVAGVITDQGFGYVVNWLYLRFIVKFAIAMISLFILMVIGYHATRSLLETANSLQRISRENRAYFILTQALVPWLIGSIILLLIKIPNKDPQHENIIVYDLIIITTLVFTIIPTFFNRKAKPDSLRFKSKKRMKFGWLYMLIAILLIVAYRLGLDNGLHFMIRIIFRVEPYG